MASDTTLPAKAEPGLVLFVTRKWAPAMGGMETYSMRLSEELAKCTNISIVALPGQPDGLPARPAALLTFPLTVLKAFWQSRKSVTTLHLADMALWPLGLLARLSPRCPAIILSAHGTDVAYHRRKTLRGYLYGRYLRLGARVLRRSSVIANSRATQTITAETGWNHIAVVPLATEIRSSAPDGKHDGSLLFAGRLVERKGCGWFIRNVLPLLPEHITLKVAGTVWEQDEGDALSHPRVEFIGNLSDDTLVHAYRSAMCVVIPNIELANGEYEGFGLVAVEAAAAGGLVLAADCGGLRDAVLHNKTGFLVESANASAWKQQITEIAGWSNTDRKAFLGDATAAAQAHFCWQRVAAQTVEVYSAAATTRQSS